MNMPTHMKKKHNRFAQPGSVTVFPIFQHLALHYSYLFCMLCECFFSNHTLYYTNLILLIYVTKNIHS